MTRELLDELLSATEPTDPAWPRLAKLVDRAAAAIGRSGNPPPADGQGWTPPGLEDLVQEFWVSGSADKVVLGANDDRHLRALVHTEVRNIAVGELRKSGRAALHDRLVDVLGKGDFVKDGNYWHLPDQAPGVTHQGSSRELLVAAFEVPVDRLYVKETSKRETSFASREQFETVLQAVLERSGAGVSLAELKDVAQRWLNLHPPFSSVSIGEDLASHDEPVELSAESAEYVDQIWGRLGDDGRELLLFMDPKKNVSRDTAAVVGYGHDKVARVIRKNMDIMREELEGLPRDEQAAIVRHLTDRQRLRLLVQTEHADSALEEVKTYDPAPE